VTLHALPARRNLDLSRRWAGVAAAVLLLPLSSTAGAEEDAATRARKQYEDDYVRSKLSARKLVPEPSPEGKRIEKILIEVGEVFDEGDLTELGGIPLVGKALRYGNYLHTTSRPVVAERELLFRVGEPFRQALADETERNLRAIFIFNIARVVPCRGSKPDSVIVLVATKDRWSLRLETDFQYSAGRLDFFRLAVIERNLAGRYKQLSALIGMTRDTVSVGQEFIEPRLFGTRIAFDEVASLTFGRGGRGIEGGSAGLSVGQPLFSLASQWAWNVTATVSLGITRFFRGDDFYRCFAPPGSASILCDTDIRSPAQRANFLRTYDHVTPLYRSLVGGASATVTRRFGDLVKHDLTWGYGLRSRRYELLGDFPSPAFQAAVAADFLPRSEDAGYLYASYRTFEGSYSTHRNIYIYSLTEDYQLGHDVQILGRWANKLFGFPITFVELEANAQYRWRLGREDLLTVLTRLQSRGEPGGFVNNRVFFQLSNVSPVWGIGRLLFEASATFRIDDLDNQRTSLGGNSGLRGYDTDEFRGRHAVNLHLEYRTLPLHLLTVQVGGVAFYDAGHAADVVSNLKLRHSVGLGLRVFFPQVNRMVLRVDLGFPLNYGTFDLARQISFSFDQAF
jgi:hypothetical protein